MSHTLIKTDDLIIKGSYHEYPCTNPWEGINCAPTKYLSLDISIRANSKLNNFVVNLDIEDDSLKNWNEWYIVCTILKEMGYIDDLFQTTGEMRKWIELIVGRTIQLN